jgi:hypothetical protein
MTTTTSAAATRHRVSEDLVKPAGSSDRNIAGMVSEMRAWCRENGITPLDFDERLREDTAAAALGIAAETLRSHRQAGDGPAYVRVRVRVSYRLVDLAAWLVQERAAGAAEDY